MVRHRVSIIGLTWSFIPSKRRAPTFFSLSVRRHGGTRTTAHTVEADSQARQSARGGCLYPRRGCSGEEASIARHDAEHALGLHAGDSCWRSMLKRIHHAAAVSRVGWPGSTSATECRLRDDPTKLWRKPGNAESQDLSVPRLLFLFTLAPWLLC